VFWPVGVPVDRWENNAGLFVRLYRQQRVTRVILQNCFQSRDSARDQRSSAVVRLTNGQLRRVRRRRGIITTVGRIDGLTVTDHGRCTCRAISTQNCTCRARFYDVTRRKITTTTIIIIIKLIRILGTNSRRLFPYY